MINYWLNFVNARKIADELQRKYCGSQQSSILEVEIANDLHNHDLFIGNYQIVIHWDCFNCVSWIQIDYDKNLIPR